MTKVAHYYGRLHDALAAAAAGLIAFAALGITTDVIMRNTGMGVLSWMLEAVEYSLFLATFLGAPWVLRLGAHVRVDIVVGGLPPRAGRRIEAVADLVGLGVSGVLFYYAAVVALNARAGGARVIKEFIFPEWWIFAVIAASALLLIVEFVARLVRASRGAPVGTTPGDPTGHL